MRLSRWKTSVTGHAVCDWLITHLSGLNIRHLVFRMRSSSDDSSIATTASTAVHVNSCVIGQGYLLIYGVNCLSCYVFESHSCFMSHWCQRLSCGKAFWISLCILAGNGYQNILHQDMGYMPLVCCLEPRVSHGARSICYHVLLHCLAWYTSESN